MGTIRVIKPTGVATLSPNLRTNGGWPGLNFEGWQKYDATGVPGVSSDVDLLNGLLLPADASVGGTGYLNNSMSGTDAISNSIIYSFSDLSAAVYSLDGAAPIPYIQLPPGILFRLNVKATFFSSACGGDFNNHLYCELNNSMEADVDSTTFMLFEDLQTTGFPVDFGDNFILPSSFVDMRLKFIQTFTDGFCDLRPIPTGSGNGVIFAVMALDISGDYTIQQNSWTIDPPSLTLPDNVITITRPTPEPDDVPISDDPEEIEALEIDGEEIEPDDPWVILWLRRKIIIHLNVKWLEDEPPVITVRVRFRGTEFTGFVTLGTLAITYADLSGIYFLDSTAHTDTLYKRVPIITTQQVKIPAPFFVIAFFGDNEANILHFGGTRIRITGRGSLHQVFQSYDYVNTLQLPDVTLRTSSNINPFTIGNFIDQQASLRVVMDEITDFMDVNKITIFWIPLYTDYPQ